MNYNKHIVMLCPGFAANEADTTCTPYLQDYFHELHRVFPNWRITIIAFQYPFKRGKYLWNGIEVNAIGGANSKFRRLFVWRRVQRLILNLHRKHAIDVIHSFWLTEAAFIGDLVAKKLGIRHIASALGQDIKPSNKYLKRLKSSNSIFACQTDEANHALEKVLSKASFKRFVFGIQPEHFKPRKEESIRDIDLLAVGSLIPIKRYDRFLRVVSSLRHRFPEIKAVLVGDGPLCKSLEAEITELGLSQNIELKGQIPREEVFELMHRAKVFVHTSESEGMGYVFAEALACGAHIVSTAVGVYQKGEKWSVADHTHGISEKCAFFLENPVDFEPRFPFLTSQTVAAFVSMYSENE